MSSDIATKLKQAFAHHQRSEWALACALYEEILQDDPMHFDALQLLGTIHAQSGSKQRALELLTQALTINQTNAVVFMNQGFVLNDLGRFDAAVVSFEEVLKRNPDLAEAHFGRANALHELGAYEPALSSFLQATKLNPDYAQAYLNMGVLQKEMNQLQAASQSYEKAIKAKPDYAEAYCNRGVALHALKQFQEALVCFDKAIALKPDYEESYWNKSLTCLMIGDFEQGWSLYESRWKRESFTSVKREFNSPRWTGEQPLKAKSILLYGEQGLGDIIQFCRYTRSVAGLGATVVLELPQPLVELCTGLEGVSKIVTYGLPLPEVDFHCPLMSLPTAFKTDLNNIPSPDAYLKSDSLKVSHWKARLGFKNKPRVGLVWSGNSAHKNDMNRSLTLEALFSYLPEQFQYVSLQKEVRDGDLSALRNRPEILNFSDQISDFSDTAARVECMDLVISVDTSVAHLSAAMGKPTWIMLANIQDWRWLLDRSDSPWYSKVKLFRQEKIGQWNAVFEELQLALFKAFPSVLNGIFQAALLSHQKNDYDLARRLYQSIVRIDPENFEVLQLLGTLEAQTGNKNEALIFLGKALKIKQDNPVVWNNHGNVLNELGRYVEAAQSYRQAIDLKPDYAQAYNNLGLAVKKIGQLQQALSHYDQAVSSEPTFAQAYNNRGIVLKELGRFEEALKSYEQSIEIEPRSVQTYINHALLLKAMRRPEQALDSLSLCLAFNTQHAQLFCEIGILQQELNQITAAIESYKKALSLSPSLEYIPGILQQAKMYLCDWSEFEQGLQELNFKIVDGQKVTTPFSYLSLNDSLSLQKLVNEVWTADKYPEKDSLGPVVRASPSERIRLGYYSADFHNHATAYLMAELFELHDKECFELIAFSFGPIRSDSMRARLTNSFDRFIEVGHIPDIEVAKLSREMGIDIAIDLKGYTGEARPGIFAYRAAPIQVGYIGYPSTMAADYMDYLIADHVLVPEASQRYYAEKIVYMPHSYQVNDGSRQIATTTYTRSQLGLPEKGFVYCCFNNNYKITPKGFDGWMRILNQVAGSVLWLLEDNPEAAKNLRKEARARGIDPDRLIFAPRMSLPEHLARHRLADLFLDTLPYNAHTTASDALWAGLPVLTCPGESFASRVAASLVHAVGLPELITRDQADYEGQAVKFAQNPEKLAAVKIRLEQNRLSSPLFDTKQFTCHLESAYLAMIDRYRAQETADHIYVH